MVSEADAEAALVETMTAEENPSDTLMVRLIGELEENQIKWLGRMKPWNSIKLTQKSTWHHSSRPKTRFSDSFFRWLGVKHCFWWWKRWGKLNGCISNIACLDVLFSPYRRHVKKVDLSFPSFLRPQESLSSACSTSKGCAHDVGSIDQKVKGLLFREFLLCEWCNDSKESNDCSRTLSEAKKKWGQFLREEHLFWQMSFLVCTKLCLKFV